MDFYLSFNNGAEQLRLPVLPSSFDVTQKHNNTVLNITNLGEISLIGKTALSTMSISSFFPAQEYYFCKYTDFPSPSECIRIIQNWKKQNKPIRLIITETLVNYAVTIESFSFSEQDGTRDVYFTLDLREYVFIEKNRAIVVDTKTSKPATTTTKTPSGTNVKVPTTKRETKPIPPSYKPQKNDTLYTVAKKTTGSMSNAKDIAATNKLGHNKYKNLTPGLELLV